MFVHLAAALVGGTLTLLGAWRFVGCGALLLAPLGGSLASLAAAAHLLLRGRQVPAADPSPAAAQRAR